jgi:hypothetical protein
MTMRLCDYFEQSEDTQRSLSRRCGIHEGRMVILKRHGIGFPASVEQALAILRETGGKVTPNDFLPDGALPKRAARGRKTSR